MGQEARYLASQSVLSLQTTAATAARYLPWLAGFAALYYFFKPSK